MRVRHGLLAVATLALVAGCQKAPKFTPDDETTLKASFDAATKSMKAGQWDTWAATMAEDGVFQPEYGKPMTGRAAVAAWGKALPPLEVMSFTSIKVAGDGLLAYGTSDYVIKMQGMPADTGKQLVVFKKDDAGKWWLQAVSFNTNIPQPPPPAPKATPAKAPAKKAPAKKPPRKGGK